MTSENLNDLLISAANADDSTAIKLMLHGALTLLAKTDERLTDIEDHIQALRSAFPGDDPDGHRRAHEAMIARTEEIRRLRVAIVEKTLAGIVWAGVIWAGTACWRHFISGVK